VGAEERAVDPGREVALLSQIAGAETGKRHQRERRPVAEQPDGRDDGLRPPRGRHEQQGGDEIAHGDPLKHPRDPDRREIEARHKVQDEPKREDDQRAPDDLRDDRPSRFALGKAASERKRDRHADDEQEEGKDQIGRRAAMPVGMPERRTPHARCRDC
jgi:hypothetical protein